MGVFMNVIRYKGKDQETAFGDYYSLSHVVAFGIRTCQGVDSCPFMTFGICIGYLFDGSVLMFYWSL